MTNDTWPTTPEQDDPEPEPEPTLPAGKPPPVIPPELLPLRPVPYWTKTPMSYTFIPAKCDLVTPAQRAMFRQQLQAGEDAYIAHVARLKGGALETSPLRYKILRNLKYAYYLHLLCKHLHDTNLRAFWYYLNSLRWQGYTTAACDDFHDLKPWQRDLSSEPCLISKNKYEENPDKYSLDLYSGPNPKENHYHSHIYRPAPPLWGDHFGLMFEIASPAYAHIDFITFSLHMYYVNQYYNITLRLGPHIFNTTIELLSTAENFRSALTYPLDLGTKWSLVIFAGDIIHRQYTRFWVDSRMFKPKKVTFPSRYTPHANASTIVIDMQRKAESRATLRIRNLAMFSWYEWRKPRVFTVL